MIRTDNGQPERWIEATRDAFGVPHAKVVSEEATQTSDKSIIGRSPKTEPISTLPKRSLPSQQVWRHETVMGRIVNFFEQSVFILRKLWPKRSPKVDQRLMAAIHADRISAAYPGLQVAPLSQILKYMIPFLKAQKGEMAPPKGLIKSLQKCAKWSSELEKIGTFSNPGKRAELLNVFCKNLSQTIKDLPSGISCILPGGWGQGLQIHPALYEITKNPSGSYKIRILSRDLSVNPHATLASAGKLKIYPETTFDDLTAEEISNLDWLNALLSLQLPLASGIGREVKPNTVSPDFNSLSQLFLPFADRIDQSPKPIENYQSFLKNPLQTKNVWMLVDMIGMGGKVSLPAKERRKLQIKVNTLFEFFEVVKKDLSNNLTNQLLLKEGVQNVSRLTSLMFAEGQLSEAEIAVLNRECAAIERTIAKAKNEKVRTSKKNPFLQKSRITPFVFHKKELNVKPFNSKWITSLLTSSSTMPETQIRIDIPEEILQKSISKEKNEYAYKLNIDSIPKVLSGLCKECEELNSKNEDYDLQNRILDFVYAIELPKITKPQKTEHLYDYQGGSINWDEMSPELRQTCCVELGKISKFLVESALKTETVNPEKLMTVIKVGILQEYLVRLDSDRTRINDSVVITFWPQVLSEYLRNFSARLRSYSIREDQLRNEIIDQYGYTTYISSFSSNARPSQKILTIESRDYPYQRSRKSQDQKDTVRYQRPLQLFANKVGIPPQVLALDQQMELFQRIFQVKMLGVEFIANEASEVAHSARNKKYQYAPVRAAAQYGQFPDKRGRSLKTEEAIRDNPEKIFADLLKRLDFPFPREAKNLPSLSKPDLADLLVAVGKNGIIETMGLLKQKPYLLEIPDVRALLEHVIFGGYHDEYDYEKNTLHNHLKDNEKLARLLADWIKEQFKLFSNRGKIPETLFMIYLAQSLENLSPDLIQNHRIDFEFPDYTPLIREWAYASLDHKNPEFEYRHILWTHLLLMYENLDQLSTEQIVEFLEGNAILNSTSAEIYELDPLQQIRVRTLREKWKNPIKLFLEKAESKPVLEKVLDSICLLTNSPPPGKEWVGSFPLYMAGDYQIDLLKGTLNNKKEGWSTQSMPLEIKENPVVGQALAKMSIVGFSSKHMQCDAADFYHLDDPQNRAVVVVASSQKDVCVYREITSREKKYWLQYVPKESLFALSSSSDKGEELAEVGLKSILKAIKQYKKAKSESKLPEFLDQPNYSFWVDSRKPSHFFVMDDKGNALYWISLKQGKSKQIIDHVIDLRVENEQKEAKVGSLTDSMHPVWQQLKSLDSPSNILVWKTKSKIQKVELTRYGLDFIEKDGKVVCASSPLNGWILEVTPSESTLKKGLPHALLLTHPKIASQHRLIVPQLTIEPNILEFSYRLFFNAIKSTLKGHFLSLDKKDPVRSDWKLSAQEGKQDYWIFDIDPISLNLKEISEQSIEPYTYLARVAHLLNQPERSLEFLLSLTINPKKWVQGDVNALQKFITDDSIKTPDNIALKLQAALIGKKLAPRAHKHAFTRAMAELYKEYLQYGGKISGLQRISAEHELLCLRALEEYDEQFYLANAPMLLQRKEALR